MLIASGAGSGIAATFDTPIGGVVFAIELMMPVVSPASLLYVALACVTATYVGQSFFSVFPAFNVPALAMVEGPGVPAAFHPRSWHGRTADGLQTSRRAARMS